MTNIKRTVMIIFILSNTILLQGCIEEIFDGLFKNTILVDTSCSDYDDSADYCPYTLCEKPSEDCNTEAGRATCKNLSTPRVEGKTCMESILDKIGKDKIFLCYKNDCESESFYQKDDHTNILIATIDDTITKNVLSSLSKTILNCDEECSKMTAYCTSLDSSEITGSFNTERAFGGVFSLIQEGRNYLEKQLLLQLFGGNDNTGRSGIDLSNGKFVNTGPSNAVIKTNIKISKDGSDQLMIILPKALIGAHEIVDGKFSVIFQSPKNSAILNFSDKEMNDDWGGIIRQITLSKSEFIIRTDNGCIYISF